MLIKLISILLLLSLANHVQCAKILGVFPAPAPSHYNLGSALLRGLAEKGHEVTMISCFSEKDLPSNISYRDVTLTGVVESLKKMQEQQKLNMFDREGSNPFISIAFIGAMMSDFMEAVLKHENTQKLIHSGEKFDVVIVEQFMNDAQKALATHFGAPLIVFSTVGANSMINSLTGNPSPLSYIPEMMLDFGIPMSFCQKLVNAAFRIWADLIFNFYVYPTQNQHIKKYIPNGPDINDVLYNSSIVLMNSHPSINQPVPYVPNMIDVGGFHVKPPKKLPQDIQEFLDEATEGVIYFSMGSNLKSAQLPVEKRDAILKTFSKLKQKVLWKWEEDVLPGQPKNVKLGKWFPQQDILAHPNVKLFITHGGFLSTTETVYHGVPILAIPVFGDQKSNARNAVNHGFGLVLPYSQISEENFTQRIQELLNNPKYKENAKLRSKVFHDRLVSPLDTAIYWVEYVVRHKGAPLLRVAGLDLPWYKYHLLDVAAFLVLSGLCGIFVSLYIIRLVFRKLCSKKKQTKVKRN